MDALELVAEIRAGRRVRECQEELYLKVRDELLERIERRLSSRVRPRLDPEDVLHEAFLRALGGLALFTASKERAFYAWVYRIAENVIVDQGRRRSAANLHLSGPGEPGGPRASRIISRERGESVFLGKDRVERILSRLKAREAEVVRLHKIEGRSFAEIARLWGKSPGAVQRFYSRALDRCRSLAEEAEGLR